MSPRERELRRLMIEGGFRSWIEVWRAARVDPEGPYLAIKGRRRLRPETVGKIATALGVRPSVLGLLLSPGAS